MDDNTGSTEVAGLRRRLWLTGVLAAALAIAVAAMAVYLVTSSGGDDDRAAAAASPVASPAETNSRHAQAVAFVRCLRENGVPNFPDPRPDGGIGLDPSLIDVNGPAYKKAEQACESQAPKGDRQGAPAGGRPQPGGQAGAQPGAQPGQPQPGESPGGQPQAAPQGNRPLPDVSKYVACMRKNGLPDFPEPNADGMFTGIDLGSAEFRAAQQTCQKLLPADAPRPPAA
ncbi:hypothetical protein [Microbispora sp. NBC_01389]|uniref:hypothetical protein n=1 Tax=Microbispora sp. NBC_01389 TaxID=2903584 RepID=UPI00324BAFE7